jgi:CheY-like chemotaxis protein
MAELLMTPELDPVERQHYVQVILNSGQTLLTLLNDILDLSKIEANKLELENITFIPADILRETQTLFAKAAADKGLRLDTRHGTADLHRFIGDPNRLRQMLCNLISNAIKFTEHGDIIVEFREIESDETHAVLEFAVSDTGVGIPADKQPLIFAPFSQADSSTTRRYGGTGLGLSIVRYLAERMGGNAGFDSMAGRGSRFWFRVSAERIAADEREAAAIDTKAEPDLASEPRRVLVVEDNATNRTVVAAMLKRLEVSFETATNGQEALDRIMGGDEIDLVLMDCQMPVMDGLEATRRIRQWEQDHHAKRSLPIIALTAGAFEEDRDRCLAAGMNDFLTKPLALRDLSAIFGKWIASA